MAGERQTIVLDEGKEVGVAPVTGAAEFMAQVLGGAPSKRGMATLRIVKNATGVPFVAVLMGNKHVGLLSQTECAHLLPFIASHSQQGVEVRAKGVVTVSADDPSRAAMRLALPPAGGPLAGVAPAITLARALTATAPVVAVRPAASAAAAAAPASGPAGTPAPARNEWAPVPGPRAPMAAEASSAAGSGSAAVLGSTAMPAGAIASGSGAASVPPWQQGAFGPAAARPLSEPKRASGESWLKKYGPLWKAALVIIVAVAALLIVRTLTDSKFDNKETFLWGDLYYTDEVEEFEAQKLGAFWEISYQKDDEEFTFALDRSGDTFEFSMILTDEDRFNPAVPEVMDLLGEEIAYAVFPGYGVEILLCDEHFEPYATYGPYPQEY